MGEELYKNISLTLEKTFGNNVSVSGIQHRKEIYIKVS